MADDLRTALSNGLLVAGYPLAAWAAIKLWPTWRDRRVRRFLAFEAGTTLVATGLAVRGRPLAAAANGATAVALGAAWVARDRRRK